MAEKSSINPVLSALVDRHRAWDLCTHHQRWEKRRRSSPAELAALYDDVVPYLTDFLEECDRFPLGELPETHRALFNIALSVAEIAPHVELYGGGVKVPNSFDEDRVSASDGNIETWRGQGSVTRPT